MSTYQGIEKSYDRLQHTLGVLLGDRKIDLTINQEGDHPIIVLETKNDSAGFTIVNGTPKETYDSAYAAFKKLYRNKHEIWKKRNLSFIVCSESDLKKHEEIFNSIESDAYFCRKYVVRLLSDQEKLEKELRRLPFLPLDEHYPKDVNRPIPAQSLLQNLEIDATLSRHLIESGKRSAIGIVEDLMGRSNNLPEIKSQSIKQTNTYFEPIENTRVKNLTIQGFRAYGEKQKFDLDADIVVLYGPNGLGKTSFFDAVDFVTTGRIGRLSDHYRNINSFQDIAQNLATSEPGKVKIEIKQGENSSEVYRKVDDWSYAHISDEKYGRKDTIQKLTLANWGEFTERIEILERLFRATHLFSQSNPEFLIDFEKESKLSSDLVSRALALEDYATGLSKVNDVLSVIEKRIKKWEKKIETVQSEIIDLEEQKDELPNPEKEEVGPKFERMTKEIKSVLKKHTDIDVEEAEINKKLIREWRSLVDAELANSRDSLKNLQKIESAYPQYESQKESLDEKTKQLKKVNFQIKESLSEKKELEFDLEKLHKKLEEEKNLLSSIRSKKRNLSEFKELKGRAHEIQKSLKDRRNTLTEIIKRASDIEGQIQELESDIERLNTDLIELKDSINEKSKKVNILSKIEAEIGTWYASQDKIEKIQKAITSLELELEEIGVSVEKKQNLIKEYEEELFNVENKLEKFTSNKAELSSLLDDLENYIKDGVCPVCGVNHKSKEVLIGKIQEQKEFRPEEHEVLVSKSQELTSLIKEANDLLSELKHTQEIKNKELKNLSKRNKVEQEELRSFNSLLEKVNFSSNEAKLQNIAENLASEKKSLKKLKDEFGEKEDQKLSKEKQIRQFKSKNDQLIEQRNRINSKIEDLKKQMEDFHHKAEELDISLDINSSEIASIEEEWIELETKSEKKVNEIKKELKELKEEINKVEELLDEKNQNSDELNEQIENLQFDLERYEELTSEYFKHRNFDLDSITELRKKSNQRVNELQRLVHQILTFERALDSVELSAMVAELESNIKISSKKEKEANERLKELKELKEWFSDVKDILNKQNKNAVKNHVQILGPLSSLIQKRLRSVYGFGDISLYPAGNEIRVEVDWNGEKVRPTDYFSDSQKQILMLSLFMSGRLTQTWSGFAPILLDDPVTHFDDLNAYGFVELIRGLVSTSPGKRQFIISTCEERLFDLMRNKFGSIEGGAKFYEFQSITDNGPTIKELEN